MSAPRVESATASKTMAPKSRNISGKEHNNTATAQSTPTMKMSQAGRQAMIPRKTPLLLPQEVDA